MDIQPTKEKKKKKVSKKRAYEINRRRESVLKNSDADKLDNLLAPSVVPLLTHSAPGSRRGSVTEIENIMEAEDPHSDEEDNEKTEDLWKHTLPIAVMESAWKTKSRRASIRRRSSGVSEEDTKATLDRLRMEKTANVFKTKNDEKPKFFWDKPADEVNKPEP